MSIKEDGKFFANLCLCDGIEFMKNSEFNHGKILSVRGTIWLDKVLCGILMTACDVAAISKPWEIQHKIAKLVADEFFDQGDLEKEQLNQQPVAMMDRDKKDELPKMQLSFIDVICLPLYKLLSETFPWLKPLYDGVKINRQNWQDLAEKVDMGLTWIDHDVIEKPVEEFTIDSEQQDINFVVTTLQCNTNAVDGDKVTGEVGRQSRSKWKLRRLFKESSHLRKSTSSHSKASSDITSLHGKKEETGPGPPMLPTSASSSTNQKSNSLNMSPRNGSTTHVSSSKQNCLIS